jgi:hypothetical protein
MTIKPYNRYPDNDWRQYTFDIKAFKDKDDFIKQVTDANLAQSSTFRKSTGFKDYYEDLRYQDETDYSSFSRLQKTINDFDTIFDNIDMGGAFKKKKLKITDDKRGIFSFGVASKGLFRAIEYFSEELAQDNPIELQKYSKTLGVVPANLVESIVMLGEKQFWYTSDTLNKMYRLERQQEGTAELLSIDPNAEIKYTENGIKYVEPSRIGKASLKFKTSTKKSYLMFDKKGGKAEMVELYMPVHLGYQLTNALPVFLIARYLQTVGIKVRITAIRMYHERDDHFVMWSIPVKDYGEEMDFNNLALVGLDRKWWDLIYAGVRTLTANGSSLRYNGQGDQAGNEADYIEAFSRYRNWYEQQIQLGLLEPLRVDKKLLMIAGLIGKRGKNLNYNEEVLDEFYRVMDKIDFFFNKPELVVQRIYKRLVDDQYDKFFVNLVTNAPNISKTVREQKLTEKKQELISDLKTHVQQVLSDTYTYPIGGQYPESQESADKLEEEYDTKLEAMNNYLKTL